MRAVGKARESRATSDDARHLVLRIACAGVLLLVLCLAFTPGIGAREDLGRHLLLGRLILETQSVPRTNLLTYTWPDFPFVDHHWLSEVWLFALHRLVGLNGLVVWQMAMTTAALAIALGTVRPRRQTGLFWLAGLGAAVLLAARADVRPELFTFLGVALYGRLFERVRRRDGVAPRVAILVLGALWTNLHVYFVFGVGMAAAFALERCWTDPRPATWRTEAAWLAGLVALACAGPNGVAGFLYPLRIFSNYGVDVSENAAPLTQWQSVLSPTLLVLPLFSLGVLAAIIRLWRDRNTRLADVVIVLAALIAAWRMTRSVPLLALTGLPVIGAALSTPVRRPDTAWVARAALVVAALANVALLRAVLDGHYSRMFAAPVYPTPLGLDDQSRLDGLRTLVARYDLRGPVFTDYDVGSLAEYALFPQPGYVDNRPEAFPAAFWRDEYRPAMGLGAAWTAISARRGFNLVIVSLGVGEQFIRTLMSRGGWVLVHVDDACVVFVRDDPRNAAAIAALGFDTTRMDAFDADVAARIDALPRLPWWRRQVQAERAVYRLFALSCVGERRRVWPHVVRLHAAYPDWELVGELMDLSAPPAEADRIRGLMRERARWPVSVKEVLDWASVLVFDGKPDDARAVLRRGRLFFPLSPALRAALAGAPG